MSRIRHPTLALLMLVPAQQSVAGSIPSLIDESQFFEPIPVIASTTRLVQPTDETPASVTLIERDIIHASGALELVDRPSLAPGFQASATRGGCFTLARCESGLRHVVGGDEQARMTLCQAGKTDRSIDGEEVEGCTRVDLRLAKSYRLTTGVGQPEFIVRNLGGDYAEFFNPNVSDTWPLVRSGDQFD